MQPLTIRLIRHGQTDLNRMNKYVSRFDPDVNECGRGQVFSFLERADDVEFSAIYTSPLKRCAQSSKLIADHFGIPTYIDDRLKEIDLGNFEGLSPDELLSEGSPFKLEYEGWRNNDTVKFPISGECVHHAIARISDFWNSLRGLEGNILVCCHSILTRLFLCEDILDISYKKYRKLSMDNGRFCDLLVCDGYTKINSINS